MITVKGTPTTLEKVRRAKVERPEWAASRWKGVRHSELLDTLFARFREDGTKVLDQKYVLTRGGTDMVATFGLRLRDLEAPDGTDFAMGVVNTNSGRSTLKVAVGATIQVCQNGMVSGEILLRRKHTAGLELECELNHAVDDYMVGVRGLGKEIASLKRTTLEAWQIDHVLMEAGRAGLMPWSRIGRVDKEFRSPRFEEFSGNTSWSLLNAFTYVAKMDPPHRQLREIHEFRKLLPTANRTVGLAV